MQDSPVLRNLDVAAANAIVALCGAVVLLLLDIWLRRRSVRDPALVWISVGLLSWSAAAALKIAAKHPRLSSYLPHGFAAEYYFSPVSSILFAVSAFRLYRVRDLLRDKDLRLWPLRIVLAIVIVSAIGLALQIRRVVPLAGYVDAIGSFMALSVMGAGLIYSFYKYGNHLLIGLTAITFTVVIARQFTHPRDLNEYDPLGPIWIAGTAMQVMLYIALAVAWGLSETSRARIVGGTSQVTVLVMFFDLRGSTEWSREAIAGNYSFAGTTMDELRMWAWDKASAALSVRPNLVKFLGDGFMFVWECPANAAQIAARINSVTALGVGLAAEYSGWASNNDALCWPVPQAIGVGIDVGPAIRINFENGSEDYLGAPINIAAKLQDKARPSGGVVIQEEVWKRLDPDGGLSKQFTTFGQVAIGNDRTLRLRATEGVDLTERIVNINPLKMLRPN